jgi:predicted  nucleic acid-binding Zn-ribbon protein
MTQADALQQALARFGASIETLERALAQLLEERATVDKLKEQLRSLQSELDAERARAGRLEIANDEVSGRLEAVMGTLKDMMSAKRAEI